MSRCLVTGATGFVGSHVARALVERGDDVRVTVRAGSPSEPLEGVDAERVKLSGMQPGARVRAGRLGALVDRRRAALPAAPHPGLRGRRHQHRRRPRRRRRAPARRRARAARRALHPRQPQLHLGPPVRRAGAGVGGGAARGRCPPRSRWRWPSPAPGCPAAAGVPAEVRAAAHWWTYRKHARARELGWTRAPHEDTVEETVRWWMERLGDRSTGTRQPHPAAHGGCAGPRARRPARVAVAVSATLYRCRTPTDWLCPCGRVARELRRRGIEVEERRVPLAPGRPRRDRRADRPASVPVLVLGREVICDSVRIVEHLRWRDRAG